MSTIIFRISLALALVFAVIFVILLITYYRRKAKYYHDLTHKTKPTHIRYQMYMVLCVLAIFVSLCLVFAIVTPPDWFMWLAGIGVLLTWMCQDVVKNIVAYVSLIWNGMLHLGDWIVLDKYGVEGKVTDISLTSVIIENRDCSLSSISTQYLLDANMQNMQNIFDKKTPGRRMLRKFLLDVHSVRNLSPEELSRLSEAVLKMDGDDSAIRYAIDKGETQNLHIFRLYLTHWLMSQDTVSRSPKFAIRLFDPTPEGLPLQIYAFLLPTRWEEFEQEQVRIVEHVLATIGLFGLVLFQLPAGTDTNNVLLTKED